MSYVSPSYGHNKQELEFSEQIDVVLLRLLTLLIISLDQWCMHIITFNILLSSFNPVIIKPLKCTIRTQSEQVLARRSRYKLELQSSSHQAITLPQLILNIRGR